MNVSAADLGPSAHDVLPEPDLTPPDDLADAVAADDLSVLQPADAALGKQVHVGPGDKGSGGGLDNGVPLDDGVPLHDAAVVDDDAEPDGDDQEPPGQGG